MWTRRPRPVVVADVDAGELLRLVMLGLEVKAKRNGVIASARLVELLRELHAAEVRHRTGSPAAAFAITASAPARPSTLDAEEITVAQAAEVMGCTGTWVRWLIRTGKLTARRSGQRKWLINRRSLDRYRHGERAAAA